MENTDMVQGYDDKSFDAQIGYLGPMSEYPIFHSGYPEHENLTVDWRSVPVRDARQIAGGACLKSHGFSLVPHRTSVPDFDQSDASIKTAVEEIKALVIAQTGAAEVILMPEDLAIRFSDRRGRVGGAEQAARFTHNDFTPGSIGIHISRRDPALAPKRLGKRYAAYNVWRAFSPPPQDMPLAICDARSVAASDLVTAEARYGQPGAHGVWGEVGLFRYNPDHRWYYFPDMTRDEVLIFCGYDSDPRYSSIVPHTAVEDPLCPMDAPPRWNIDCRRFAIFAD